MGWDGMEWRGRGRGDPRLLTLTIVGGSDRSCDTRRWHTLRFDGRAGAFLAGGRSDSWWRSHAMSGGCASSSFCYGVSLFPVVAAV
jgi:hypothetical protein